MDFGTLKDLFLLFQKIQHSQSELKLLNIYKGLPISCDTSILSVGDIDIKVHANRSQLACLYYQHETFLQGENLPDTLLAQVISINLSREDAVLTNSEVIKKEIGKRSEIRVEPGEPMIVMLQMKETGTKLNVFLADISTSGIGVYLDRALFHPRFYKSGDDLSVTVFFPASFVPSSRSHSASPPPDPLKIASARIISANYRSPVACPKSYPRRHFSSPKGVESSTTITARGTLINIHPELHYSRYRLGIKLNFDEASTALVLQYIAQRQPEIIRDLRLLADELYQQKSR